MIALLVFELDGYEDAARFVVAAMANGIEPKDGRRYLPKLGAASHLTGTTELLRSAADQREGSAGEDGPLPTFIEIDRKAVAK